MSDIDKIKEHVNYICYEKYLKIAYNDAGCYDLREYNEFFNLFSTTKSVICTINGTIFILNGAHAYANIKIYNGSFAKLICNESQTGITEILFDDCGNYLTLSDITIENKLYSSNNTFLLQIETDGYYCTYDEIMFSPKIYCQLSNVGNYYAISWFYSKNLALFAGNLIQQSFIVPINEIIVIPKPNNKINNEEPNKKHRKLF